MAETLSPAYKIFKSLSVSTTELYSESVQFLQEKFKTKNDLFTIASPFGQLLVVLHNLTQLILYYIEDSITELNIYEASRPSSVYSLAALAGHNPSRAISSVGTILVKPAAAVDLLKFPGNSLILTNYMNITCENNGLNYVIELPGDEVRLNLNGTTGLTLSIRQGRLQQQRFSSNGQAFQSFQVGFPNNFLIDQFMVNVYVNGEKWPRYESLLDMPRKANGFICRTGVTNGLDVFFGNGSFGAIPTAGSSVVVEYLVTEGSAGNINLDNLKDIVMMFSDTGFNSIGEEITMSESVTVTVTGAPNFGTDPESLALTRLIAPKTSKNYALVNLDNYEVLMQKLQMFSSVRVTLDPADTRMINLFLVPDITKVFSKGTDYFNLIEDKFKLTSFQKNEILKYIEKSGTKLISTGIRILDPIPSKYVLNISLVTYSGFDKASIKTQIYEKLGKYFINNTRKDRIPKSDLIKLIEEIEGVDSVNVVIVGAQNEAAVVANPTNRNLPLVGLDEFNDIIIKENEFAIIRGGFTDRVGNVYAAGLSDDKTGAVNILFKAETQMKR
jgi:hypothetical protein